MGSFIFHITAALAKLERSIIKERTRAGLRPARVTIPRA
jgi:DNA invertase Pin-like site-specific DNA recombinase